MVKRKCVMISSTARDLPEHRKEVMDACLRQGMFPVMMEHLPASDDEAISASLKMVDEADIYLGVFAHRYGYVPKESNPTQISVTEMEYNRAVERKITHLIFVMDEEHPIKKSDVEMGEGAAKLDAFKKRLLTDNIVNFFKSPADLRAYVINSLSNYREADITQFHYVSDIPEPPEAYIAHPYTLLQTHRLIGRQAELNLLTNWILRKKLDSISEVESNSVRIMNIVAIGGMGKSIPVRPARKGPAYGQWAAEALQGLGLGQANMVGASNGGWLILKLGSVAPDRIGSAVLMSSAGFLPVSAGLVLRMIPRSLFKAPEEVARGLYELLSPPDLPPDPFYLDFFELMVRSGFRSEPMAPALPDGEIAQLAAPTCLLMGQYEVSFNPYRALKRGLRLLPDVVTAEIVPGVGHAMVHRQPDWVIARVAGFLERHGV